MKKPRKPFSIWKFSLQTWGQYIALMVSLWWLVPSIMSGQFAAGIGVLAIAFVAHKLYNCFFEWFYHRYLLHAWMFWFLGGSYESHEHHHVLTLVRVVKKMTGRVVIKVYDDDYQITRVEQYESSAFPWYSLMVFWVVFGVFIIIPAQLLFSGIVTPVSFFVPGASVFALFMILLPFLPCLFGGITAVTSSLWDYEVLHSLEHRPYSWWKKAVEHPKYGWFWSRVYGFHHFHHFIKWCNEAISGFFGLPLADWVFGTLYFPKELMLHDHVATIKIPEDVPKGRQWVQNLDAWAKVRTSKMLRLKRSWDIESANTSGFAKTRLYLYYSFFERPWSQRPWMKKENVV